MNNTMSKCPYCGGEPLTEPKSLSLDELIERDKPVYVPLDDGDGYWCLCRNGYITPPSLLEFFAGDRPSWKFYDRPATEGGKRMNKICKTCGKEARLLSWQDECYECQQKAYRAKVKEEIEETGETDCESDIYCPWCSEIYEPDCESGLCEDGDHDLTCDSCGKDFTVTVNVSYVYDTKRKEASQ